MLHSIDQCVTGSRPVFMAWFGNFFEPYFSSRHAVEDGLRDLREMGMNSIVLDSKLWSDFSHFFRTGEQSPYVAMQNFISDRCREEGLGVSFLALFAMGDNLYPEIYDHPPEFIEQPVDFWGNTYRGYRHWSGPQMEAQVRHCLDLYQYIAREAAARAVDDSGAERLPFYFYHSPIFAPSFDADGRAVYLQWLESEYSLEELNTRYGTGFTRFADLSPTDYWVNPDHSDENRRYIPDGADYEGRSVVLLKHADNQRFKQKVMREYFREIIGRLRAEEPRFYFYAALSQWKMFFGDFTHVQNRGWDLWDLGQSLDSPSFITMPIDNQSQVEPYVVPCELAMVRSAAAERDFVGSLFLGRYMANDVYAVCSPAEVIASALGSGATDLYFYGYNGLDDGGNFGRWGQAEKKSLRQGLDWFSAVREVSGRRVATREVAILYPYASYTLSAHVTDTARYNAFREDLLGWFRQFADWGLNPDILHPSQVRLGKLRGYKFLAVPADPHYWAMPDAGLEGELRSFVESGGTLLHGVSELVESAFGITSQPHEPDSIAWEEKIVTGSSAFVAHDSGKPEATYLGDGRAAYVSRQLEKGAIHSFGFDYGYAYGCREHLPVPRAYKKENHYPLSMIARTPVDKIVVESGLTVTRLRGVEWIPFQHGRLLINHTPYTVDVPGSASALCTFEGFDGCHLPGRHAAFLP